MTKKQKEQENLERSALKAYKMECRKNVTLQFFKEFAKNHVAWIQKLADAYKSSDAKRLGIFGLANNYSNDRDVEIALFACLLLSDNEHLLKQQETVYEILGSHPYSKIIKGRGFVEISTGENQNKRVPGTFVLYFEVAQLLSRLYDIIEEYGSVCNCVWSIMTENKFFDPYIALSNILMGMKINQRQYKLNLLLLILCTKDGIGMDLWNLPKESLLCPENKSIIEFLEIWLPDYHECGLTFDRAVNAFELKSQTDFYYAYCGFELLRKLKATEVAKYVHLYQTRWKGRDKRRLYEIKKLQPAISFEVE